MPFVRTSDTSLAGADRASFALMHALIQCIFLYFFSPVLNECTYVTVMDAVLVIVHGVAVHDPILVIPFT